jgi:hypothetical protein
MFPQTAASDPTGTCDNQAVVLTRNPQRKSELTRTRAQIGVGTSAPPESHSSDPPPRFHRTNENQPVPPAAFDVKIEKPVHPIIQIDISCSGGHLVHEFSGAFTGCGVTRCVSLHRVPLSFDYDSGTSAPHKLNSHQFARNSQKVALKEIGLQKSHARK